MLVRFWTWTNEAPDSGVPFGPLRFRDWTSPAPAADAESGVPFGPLRFRAWTSGDAEPEPPEVETVTPGKEWGGWREYIEAQRLPREVRELVDEAVDQVLERVREPTKQQQDREQVARDIAALEEAFDREGVAWAQQYGALLARIRGWIEAEAEASRLAELSQRMQALALVQADIAAALHAFRTRNDNAIRALLMMM